jgi:hypothetical protein
MPTKIPSRWAIVLNLVFAIIIVFYIRNVRFYLDKLESCNCAPLAEAETINFFEAFYLCLQYIVILMNLAGLFVPTIFAEKWVNNKLMFVWALILFIVNALFVYHVYKFHQGIKDNCDCADKIQKDMLYVQAVYYGLVIAAVIFILTAILFLRLSK